MTRIQVTNHWTGASKMFEGTDSLVLAELFFEYPFLRMPNDATEAPDLEEVIEHLDSVGGYQVETMSPDTELAKSEVNRESILQQPIVGYQMGFQPLAHQSFVAAQFLACMDEAPQEAVRRAIWEHEHDLDAAALQAYGLQVNDANRKALRAVQALIPMAKSEMAPSTAHSVIAAHVEGEDVAEAIRRAYADMFVLPVALGGKHSGGCFLARDEHTRTTWLLKPGTGGAGATSGANQDRSSSSQREAAWHALAKEIGLYHWFPRTELVLVDGAQFAAIQLLSWNFQTAEKRRETDPSAVRRAFGPLLRDGVVHQIAFMDAVFGNGDDHGQNCMINEHSEVRFIDHGSSFCGTDFDPAHDANSFTPYILRGWVPGGVNFNALSSADKLRYLPNVDSETSNRLKLWCEGLSSGAIEAILHRYGIDPVPSLKRLSYIRSMILATPFDVAINRFFTSV